ncbi:MAG TPA: response regulator [Thermoanaerobaculia bacterium]
MESKKVLVVDNDEVVLVLISHILTRQSYTVVTSPNLLTVERLLEAEPYDAILLDLKMPDGSGVELINALAERNPSILKKVIVVTGALHEAKKIADLPLHAIMRKPFEVGSLIDTVKSCVDGRDEG